MILGTKIEDIPFLTYRTLELRCYYIYEDSGRENLKIGEMKRKILENNKDIFEKYLYSYEEIFDDFKREYIVRLKLIENTLNISVTFTDEKNYEELKRNLEKYCKLNGIMILDLRDEDLLLIGKKPISGHYAITCGRIFDIGEIKSFR